MRFPILCSLVLTGLCAFVPARADTVGDLLTDYRKQSAGPFEAAAGEMLWQQKFPGAGGAQRACSSCHTNDTTKPGRHAVTGKTIEPLAPSVNAKRLTDHRKIEKWLKRNCKWTLGRACTTQEKGDLLSFLHSQ